MQWIINKEGRGLRGMDDKDANTGCKGRKVCKHGGGSGGFKSREEIKEAGRNPSGNSSIIRCDFLPLRG